MKFGIVMCIERVCVENDLCENQILALSVRGVSALVMCTSVSFIAVLKNYYNYQATRAGFSFN